MLLAAPTVPRFVLVVPSRAVLRSVLDSPCRTPCRATTALARYSPCHGTAPWNGSHQKLQKNPNNGETGKCDMSKRCFKNSNHSVGFFRQYKAPFMGNYGWSCLIFIVFCLKSIIWMYTARNTALAVPFRSQDGAEHGTTRSVS